MMEITTEFKLSITGEFSSDPDEDIAKANIIIRDALKDAFTMSELELGSIKLTFKEM